MIYFDNAATSFPKPDRVYEEMEKCLKNYCANPGRGGHKMSIKSAEMVFKTREIISEFFNFDDPLQLCFTKNATEALNIAIKGILNSGDHVITTCMEHNSVIRPLKTLEKEKGIEISIIKADKYGCVDPDDMIKEIKKNTRLIVSTFSSNVNGIIMPVKEIGKIAKKYGIPLLVDASQGAGSIKIDVKEMNIDMLAFPAHKGLLGPQGVGGLYVNKNLKLHSLIEGGTGSNSESIFQPEYMPELLESGTLNTPGIIGLMQGIDFINEVGIENINAHKHKLIKRLHEGLERLDGIRLYSKNSSRENSGIVALNVEDIDSTEISYVLDKVYNIATRAGLHCAPLAHKTLGTFEKGLVRLSVGYFNTTEEIDKVLDAFKEIISSK